MAELLLTEEEKKLPFLDWDDANLGRAVKAASLIAFEDDEPNEPHWNHVRLTACCVPLIASAVKVGSNESTVTIEGAVVNGEEVGDWEVVVRRKNS